MNKSFAVSMCVTILLLAPLGGRLQAEKARPSPTPVALSAMSMPTGFIPTGTAGALAQGRVAVSFDKVTGDEIVLLCRNGGETGQTLDLQVVSSRNVMPMMSRVMIDDSEEIDTVSLSLPVEARTNRSWRVATRELGIVPSHDTGVMETFAVTVKGLGGTITRRVPAAG